jgi:hypothetical protein
MASKGAFVVPPVCRGQAVEVAYADTFDGRLWRRVTDRSLPTGDAERVRYAVTHASDCGCEHECDCWDPINSEPNAYTWTPSTERAFRAALED